MSFAVRRWFIGVASIVFVFAAGGFAVYLANRGKLYDPTFDTRVAEPAYRSDRPRVLYDEAHLNVPAANGGYKGFAELITNDGYDVQVNRDAFTADRLAG